MDNPGPLPFSIFVVDIQRYSARDHALDQLELRRHLRELLLVATEAVRIDRGEWHLQDTGDGELALVPASVSKPWLVAEFVRELALHLEVRNRPRRPEDRVRLRVAMHHGDVIVDGAGYVGDNVNSACRLVDSAPVRAALDRIPEADLAVILSDRMYQDVKGHRGLHERHFRQVEVAVKTFTGRAWLWVFGFPPPDLSTPDSSGRTAVGGSDPAEAATASSAEGGRDRVRRGHNQRHPVAGWQSEISTVHGDANVGDRTYHINDRVVGVPIFGDPRIGKLVRHDDEEGCE